MMEIGSVESASACTSVTALPSDAGCQIEREGHRRKLARMVDRERADSVSEM